MKRTSTLFFLLSVLFTFKLFSQPNEITLQGVLKDSNGNKLDGSFVMTFNFYDSENSQNPVFGFTPATKVQVKEGVFNVTIDFGANEIFKNNAELWLGVKVENEAEFPKIKIASVGYALHAKYADTILNPASDINCTGCVSTNDLADGSITQNKIKDGEISDSKISSVSWNKITDVPQDLADGDDTGVDGSGDVGYIPKFSDSKLVDNSIMVQTDEKIGISTSSPVVKLDVNGGIKVGFVEAACTNQLAGVLRFNQTTKTLELCDGSKWQKVNLGSSGQADCSKTFRSCLDILENNCSSGDGLYVIDPDGDGGSPAFQAYCDMTTDGGGWTLILRDNWDTQEVAKGLTTLPSENSAGNASGSGDYIGPYQSLVGNYLYVCKTCSGDNKFVSHQSVHFLNSKNTVMAGIYDQPIKTLAGNTVMADAMSSHRLNFFYNYNGSSCGPVSTGRDNGDNCWNNFFGNNYWENLPGGSNKLVNSSPHIVELYVRERDGKKTQTAAFSCTDIKNHFPNAKDGFYWIDPDGTGDAMPIQMYCFMSQNSVGLFVGNAVQNDYSSIMSGCPQGYEPFKVKSQEDANLLKTFVTEYAPVGTWFYANVFAGPDNSCSSSDTQIGYLQNATTWVDANIDESQLSPLDLSNNCNKNYFDPIPLNKQDGFSNRSCVKCLYNSSEVVEIGNVICTVKQ